MDDVRDKLILAINAGSSSIKFTLYRVAPRLDEVFSGSLDAAGQGQARLTVRGMLTGGEQRVELADASATATFLGSWLGYRLRSDHLLAVSHRIVLGYPVLPLAAGIDAALLAALHAASGSAAGHLPQQIALIEALQQRFPNVQHVACSDSAFHATMPKVAATLPIPRRWQAQGFRRYGFHGLSCEYLVRAMAGTAGRDAAIGKLVVAHLGSGASITAIHRGESRDTSMALTPASGIMMARRSGDLDPGLAWELAKRAGLDAETFHQMVNHESGLLGVSGSSGDMRELLAREAQDVQAAEAVDMYCYQVRKAIYAMAGAIGGLDTLIFTGGIGQHAAPVRERICAGLLHLGVSLAPERNTHGGSVISADDSKTCVRVMATNEQWMLAYHALRLIAPAAPLIEEYSND